MPRMQPVRPFLRPWAAPPAASGPPFVRFSTAPRLRAEQPATSPATSAADRAAAPVPRQSGKPETATPAPALEASTTAGAASGTASAAEAKVQAEGPAPERAARKTRTYTRPRMVLPPPKYHVGRSASKNLPIYSDYKRGGNLHLTTVRKITGDLSALRDELRVFLNKKNEDVKINSLTKHVVVKGHHVPEITQFLTARGM